MTDTETSDAARELAAKRWGAQKLVRLAKELELRAAELPPVERQRLIDALADHAGRGQS